MEILIKCDNCGKAFYKRTDKIAKHKNNFCSKKCFFEYLRNDVRIYKDYVIIYVENKGIKHKCYVDYDDYINKILPLCSALCIFKDKKYIYFHDKKTKKKVRLHRFLMNAKENEIVDHINRNPFDNRKSNLRIVDKVLNAQNRTESKNNKTSKVRGVDWHEKRQRWRGLVQVNNKRYFVGWFKDFNECVKATETLREEKLREYIN